MNLDGSFRAGVVMKDRMPGRSRVSAQRAGRRTAPGRKISPWARVVLVCALLVVGGTVALNAWAFGSTREWVVSYPVTGALDGVSFDVGDAGIVIAGAGRRSTVQVQARERYAFGHTAETRRSVTGGEFRLRSRCAASLPSSCSVRYRVTVPDNVPVQVRTAGGDVRFEQYRGSARVTTGTGDVDVVGFCGFSLRAQSGSGDVRASATCPPQQLALRATTGSVHAIVPDGRYRIDAQSASGRQVVRDVVGTTDAPFSIQALSSSGDVLVERGA
jgi:Putative adhesin